MKAELRAQAVRLRMEQRLGYASIAKLVPVAKSTLSSWLKDYPLSEGRIRELRSRNLKNNEAKIETFRNTMREIREEKFKEAYSRHKAVFAKLSQQTRFVAGLMLYLAEGSKRDAHRIVLTNTDPSVIKFHMAWGSEFFDVPRSSYKVQLHLYENMDIGKEVEFWRKELGINERQFFKHQIRKLRKSSFSYRESFRHGTCAVYFGGVDKKRELTAAIKAFTDSF